MTYEEYQAKRQEIIEFYTEEIDNHEFAGCFGDAESTRKWMRIKLDMLKRDYEETK